MQVYLNAWKHSKKFNAQQLETLIVSMAKLPFSFHFETPPIVTHYKVIAELYIAHHEKKKSDIAFAENVLPKIDNIINFVKVGVHP